MASKRKKGEPYTINVTPAALSVLHDMSISRLISLQDAADFEGAYISACRELHEEKNGPGFDAEACRKDIEAAGGIDAVQAHHTEIMDKITRAGKAFANNPNIKFGVVEIAKTISSLQSALKDLVNSDAFKAMKAGAEAEAAFFEAHKGEYSELVDALEGIEPGATYYIFELAPHLHKELEETQAGLTLAEVLKTGFNSDGTPAEGEYREIIERAAQRYENHKKELELVEAGEALEKELPRIIATPADKHEYPVDKVNSTIWRLVSEAEPTGQIKMKPARIPVGKNKAGEAAYIFFGLSFDDAGIKITKRLTPFDKRCYIAAGSLYNAGNRLFSASQIYYAMGNTKRPSQTDLKKINDSLTKMRAATVYVNNEQEVENKKARKHEIIDGNLLDFNRKSVYINGKLTEAAIELLQEPPLITFARNRRQITTITTKLLEAPISKTEANLLLEDYLIERIGHMRNKKAKAPRKMLFSTIYEHCNITTAKQKQRTAEKIRKYLDHYKRCKWIKGYAESADGITILL